MSEVDSVVSRVAGQTRTWMALDAGQRADILNSCRKGVYAVAEDWARQSCAAKGIPFDSPAGGEEWFLGPAIVLRHLRLYRDTLLRGGGIPESKLKPFSKHADYSSCGWSAQVFPQEAWDFALFPGVTAEVRGATGTKPTSTLGPGGCAAILGAGNVNSIAPLDFLYQMLKENRVVVMKMNPVNAYMRQILEEAFAPLVAAGFLGFVDGGADVGAELVAHERIDAVHITGSEHSFRAVVSNPEVRSKVITAELGSVTPILVVPGAWSKSMVKYQAGQIAGMMAVNGAFNCNTPKVLITSRLWPRRELFLEELRKAFAALPLRKAWYPGSPERWSKFVREYSGNAAPHQTDELPMCLLADVPPDAKELALSEEAFCPVLAECAIDAEDEESFLQRAVDFANGSIAGTLSCNILASPSTSKAAVETAIDRLNFGTISVNTWAALGFALASTPWGAFPGHTLDDPSSGMGVVHNTFLLDDPIKTVLRAKFKAPRKNVWTPGFKRLRTLSERLVDYEYQPSFARVLRLVPGAYLS
ncbi:MAG: aldehyde dehydrogenase [Planctomycetes bacterium]|nr:aldehyde dehydrogenase [Planctomycetota bacterium]